MYEYIWFVQKPTLVQEGNWCLKKSESFMDSTGMMHFARFILYKNNFREGNVFVFMFLRVNNILDEIVHS